MDLWHLRHWLQYWQLRTWINDNLCYLTINCNTGQHSQFLRCFTPTHFEVWKFYTPKCVNSRQNTATLAKDSHFWILLHLIEIFYTCTAGVKYQGCNPFDQSTPFQTLWSMKITYWQAHPSWYVSSSRMVLNVISFLLCISVTCNMWHQIAEEM